MNHRRRARGLRAVHAAFTITQQTDFLQFFEGLGNLRQDCATRSRQHDVLRQPPSKLFDQLKAERLGAFRVIWAQVDIDEGPAILVGDFATQSVDVIIIATNYDDLRAINGRADYLTRLNPFGHEDDGL